MYKKCYECEIAINQKIKKAMEEIIERLKYELVVKDEEVKLLKKTIEDRKASK